MNLQGAWRAVVGARRVARRTAPVLAIGFLADAAFLFVFLIALQAYLPESLHKSDAIAGYALASFGLAKLATQFGGGFVSDRLGTRRALILGTTLLLLADVAILPLAHVAPWLIIGAGAIEGLGSSVTWPAVYSAGASRVAADEKGRFTALLTLSTGCALITGLGGGGVLNHFVTFDAAMAFPIGAVATALTLALLTPLSAGEVATQAERELPSPREVRAIISSPQRAVFSLMVLCESAALGSLAAGFRSYGRDVLDVSLAQQALMLVPAAVAGGLMVIPGGALADRIGVRRVMAPGFAATGAGLLLLSRFSDPGFVVVTAAIAGAGFGLAQPTIAATMMALSGPSNTRGGIIGWFMTMDGIGHTVGPASAGLLLGVSGAPAVMIGAGALFLIVSWTAIVSRLEEAALAGSSLSAVSRSGGPVVGAQPDSIPGESS
jgi:DHA1 family tetracycline resistance protein-like MFS transporter